MTGQLLTIARNTFVESVRQPIYFILVALSGLDFRLDAGRLARASESDPRVLSPLARIEQCIR